MPDQIDSATNPETSAGSSSGATSAATSVSERTAKTPATSSETASQTSSEKAKDFFNRAIRSGRASSEPASQSSSETSQSTRGKATDQGDASNQADPATRETKPTPAELEERRIQSEVDRRIARANKDAQVRASRANEVRLRAEDPYAYAQLKAREEAEQATAVQEQERLRGSLETFATNVDRAVLDPIFAELSPKDRSELLQEHASLGGLEHRAAITKASLVRLEKHWRAQGAQEAEAKLRKNPAFTKQILTELRGEQEEPELVSAATSRESSADMNSWMRASVGGRRHQVR